MKSVKVNTYYLLPDPFVLLLYNHYNTRLASSIQKRNYLGKRNKLDQPHVLSKITDKPDLDFTNPNNNCLFQGMTSDNVTNSSDKVIIRFKYSSYKGYKLYPAFKFVYNM